MLITFQDNSINDELAIQWNGSATFNVGTFRGGNLSNIAEFEVIDCFTVYGKDTQGGACTFEEAKQHAEDHLRNPDGEDEGLCSCYDDETLDDCKCKGSCTCPTIYKVGDKVVFTQTIDRYPFTIVEVGDTGTIVEFEEANSDRANDPLALIKMDDPETVKDLEEWDGVLYLSNTPTTDLECHDYEGLDAIELA